MNLLSELRATNFGKYTWLCNPTLAQWIVELLSAYGNSILDVGCGNGFMIDFYLKKFKQISAIDPSDSVVSSMSNLAIEKGIVFQKASAEKIPFIDDSFDIAFAKSSLHHFDQPIKGISEMYRVARRVVAVMEVVAPSETCLPFLSNLLVKKEVGRVQASVFTEKTLKEMLLNSIPVKMMNSLIYDQYIDIETWIQYSDLSATQKTELLKSILSMDSNTAKQMQLHKRDGNHVMLRKMCLCIAFL